MRRGWFGTPTDDSEETTEVVDVRTDAEPTLRAPTETSRPVFGRPTECPSCSGKGYLDHIDIIDRIQYQHCVSCGLKWEMTEAEINSSADEQADLQR